MTRKIINRTRGESRGLVQRIIDPKTVGELIKPFVLLDYFDTVPKEPASLPMHPHSGIATLTLLLEGDLDYEDSTGRSGTLASGSVEWMRAGAGVWHGAQIPGGRRLHGLQLWVTLPLELEDSEPESQYISVAEVPTHGSARIALGRYRNVRSPVRMPASINYLHVTLRDGERWLYEPPAGHEVGWVYVFNGELNAPDPIDAGELAVFEHSTAPLEFTAKGDSDFVLGSAIKHPHELVLGYFSIHSSVENLERGAKEIARVGERLSAAGKIPAASLQSMVARVEPGSW